MSSIFACDLGLNRKTLSRNFFCCFVFRFREIFFNQHWRQMRASLILLFGKTKAFFGKDTARKKLRFCIRYLWKMEEKPANLNRGLCFSIKWKATCRNWAHLDEEKQFGLKIHLRACCTQPFNCIIPLFPTISHQFSVAVEIPFQGPCSEEQGEVTTFFSAW